MNIHEWPTSPQLSLVVPMYNESTNVRVFYERTLQVLNAIGMTWEMVCVNDGSRDDTLERLRELHDLDSRVKVIDLSRNFGKENALTAGLDYARGQAVIPMDADLQDPPEILCELVDKWMEGYEVVNAVRRSRQGETVVKRFTAFTFYRIINKMVRFELPADTGDFRLITRPVLEAVKSLRERRRFMKGIFAWVGFRTANVYYEREPRHSGASTWKYWGLWNFAIEGVTSFTQIPLQIASYLGVLVSLGSFLYGAFIILKTLVQGSQVPGYPSMMAIVLFLGGVQLIAIGVIGEYVGRIYEESKVRPLYLVREEVGFVQSSPARLTFGVDNRQLARDLSLQTAEYHVGQ